ncbi:MAG: fibronectin type III domain-containing protein [Ruminococcus sp.]|nr:fibronectin type III domain-containing protein [Ruminococcus sp.]
MKLKLVTALCLSILAAAPAAGSTLGLFTANAQDGANVYQGFEYAFTESGDIVLTKYTGADTEVTLPAEIDGKKVTSVETGAFYGCTDVKTVHFTSAETVPQAGSVGFIAEGVTAQGIKITGSYGSAAHEYANSNGFEFEADDLIDITSAQVTLPTATYTYDGSEKRPEPVVSINGTRLTKGDDYTVSYQSNINAGQAKVTVTGCGRYTGSAVKAFTINKADLTKCRIRLGSTSFIYSGRAITPAVTVTSGNRLLVKGRDYTVTCTGNTEVGTAYVTITGTGSYSGSVKKSFKIKLGSVSGVVTASATDTSITLKWKSVKGATGYRVYTIDADGKLHKKADVKSTKATVKSLSAGSYYKFAVKAYRTNKSGTYLSPSYSSTLLATAPAKVSFSIKTTKKGKADISWKKVKGATKYNVFYKRKKSDKWKKVATLDKSKSSYTLTGISGSKGGYVTVKAYKLSGSKTVGGKFATKAIYKYPKAAAKLDACGWDLKSAFRASVIPWVGTGLPRSGSVTMEWYADYGFKHGYGHCYCMAAMFTEMAKTMGYNCRQVNGAVGPSPHSWAELILDRKSYICDADFQSETGGNGFCIVYGTPGTWRYTTYGYVATKG